MFVFFTFCSLSLSFSSSLSPGSLECLPRAELEQRLTSYLIMSEALLQQVASARAQPPSSGPAPSDLRDKLIQTDHTELSQVDRQPAPLTLALMTSWVRLDVLF